MANVNEWNSNLSFILAMIGSAVGLGNIWRYPYVLYSNGGGAFYIPYIIAILVLAFPFIILEYGVGYNYQSSFTKSIIEIKSKFEYYGWILPVLIFMMTIYYSTLIGWDGIYFFLSFFKGWGSDPGTFLTGSLLHTVHSTSGILNFLPVVAISILVVWFIIWFVSHRDLNDGLGKISRIFVPLLFILMIGIVVFSLTLPGASIGLAESFSPDWSLLTHFEIWMAAFGQIFFSLSLGIGVGFTFASYSKEDVDLISSGLMVIVANCLFENFAALGVFSILGYMSLHSGVPVSNLISEGTSLIFVVYPQIFNILGAIAFILGPLFFLAIYLAGITSMLSSFEVLSISLQEKFNIPRKKVVGILCIVGLLASMVFATSSGEYLVSIVDLFVNNIVLLFSVIMECILLAWVFKAERLVGFLNERSKTLKIGRWWLFNVKYLIPIIVIIICIGGLYELLSMQSLEFEIILAILFAILLTFSLIFTVLSAKSKKWFEIEERIK